LNLCNASRARGVKTGSGPSSKERNTTLSVVSIKRIVGIAMKNTSLETDPMLAQVYTADINSVVNTYDKITVENDRQFSITTAD